MYICLTSVISQRRVDFHFGDVKNWDVIILKYVLIVLWKYLTELSVKLFFRNYFPQYILLSISNFFQQLQFVTSRGSY